MGNFLPRILIGAAVGLATYVLMTSMEGPSLQAIIAAVCGVIASVYILTALAGNRKVAMASGADKATALELAPPPGKALLVVAREGFIAKLVGINLELDGAGFAQLKSPAFTLLEIAPGAHTLTCGVGAGLSPQGKPGSYAFSADVGAVVGVVLNVAIGAGYKFTPADDIAALKRKLSGMPMVVADR